MNECPFCEVEHKTTVPTVTLNGTAPENLRDDLRAAAAAVMDAITKTTAAAPNGRDYYTLPGSMQRVSNEHRARLEALHKVYDELEEMFSHVQAYLDFRERQREDRRKRHAG